ncbi:receptor-like protein EIX1 [Silene latifolia]|uniref:receptor-like protein EIX1 n=1 Tax=Silene latifolia TaxID=37657 RepID=UPI003D77074C
MSPQFTSKSYDQSLFLLLLCVCLTYFGCHASIQCVESERDALLEFKHGIRVDRCGLLDSWSVTPDCCLWSGIQCHNLSGHVIAVDLPTLVSYYSVNQDVCLEGTIGISLLELKHLKYLNLSRNYFGGHLPKFIGSLTNLEHLDLSHVGFTGVVPNEIGNLSKLLSFNLHCAYHDYDYDMKVESLQWLSQLRLLRELDLGGIDLSLTTNNWLSIVNNLPHLRALRFDNCNLSLKLPSSLSYINSSTTISTISLVENNFNDTSIFEWLSNLNGLESSLVYLDLSDNSQLFGSTFQLSNNTWNFLDLNGNQLWGSITDNIGNLSYLRVLYVFGNQLNGTISEALWGLPKLEALDLAWI